METTNGTTKKRERFEEEEDGVRPEKRAREEESSSSDDTSTADEDARSREGRRERKTSTTNSESLNYVPRSKKEEDRNGGRRRHRRRSPSPRRRRRPSPSPRRRRRRRSPSPRRRRSRSRSPPRREKRFSKAGKTGGIYIPPFKLKRLQKKITDKSSVAYQRMKWESLRKGINGLVNKVNVSNIKEIVPELFRLNLVRGRGLLCRALMKAQMTSPGFTHIYVALMAVVNTKMPENGELLLKRVIYQFRRAYGRNNKIAAIALAKFIAHMVNQQVAHELLALQVLFLLLENPTEDSVEIAVGFTKEIGQILSELSPAGLEEVLKRFRGILHEGTIDKRVQYTIENLFAIRRNGFKDFPAVHEQLDLIESSDQITHDTSLDDESIEIEDHLDVFNEDPEFQENEKLWAEIRREVLDDSDDSGSEGGDESESGSSSDDDDDDGSSSSSSDDDDEQNQVTKKTTEIQDATETDLVNLRRTIYLTIMSSLDFEECAHKLLKINIKEGQESEMAMMLLECCSQERTYLRYYGLLGQRFCNLKREYCNAFDDQFVSQYQSIHKYETNKLRNVAKFFAHLLYVVFEIFCVVRTEVT